MGDDLTGKRVMATSFSCSARVRIASVNEGNGGDTGMSEGKERAAGASG
jgi:hypothetical protein